MTVDSSPVIRAVRVRSAKNQVTHLLDRLASPIVRVVNAGLLGQNDLRFRIDAEIVQIRGDSDNGPI